MLKQDHFIHHVYFWLEDAQSKEELSALISGLASLSKSPAIEHFHIGVPAKTNRDVIDISYHVSWLLIFSSKEAQDAYQVDPFHLHFVDTCKHLWKKVIVYDAVGV